MPGHGCSLCPSFQGGPVRRDQGRENFRSGQQLRRPLHVWLGHGESDKVTTRSGPRHCPTRCSWPATAWSGATRGPSALGTRRVRAIGRRSSMVRSRTRGRLSGRPTILYAPTWEGHGERADYSRCASRPGIIDALPDLAREGSVIMRPHPSTGTGRRPCASIRDAIFAAAPSPAAARRPTSPRGRHDHQRHLRRDRRVPVHREADVMPVTDRLTTSARTSASAQPSIRGSTVGWSRRRAWTGSRAGRTDPLRDAS